MHKPLAFSPLPAIIIPRTARSHRDFDDNEGMVPTSAHLRSTLSFAALRDPVKASRAAGVTLTVLRRWLDGGAELPENAVIGLARFAGYEVVLVAEKLRLKLAS